MSSLREQLKLKRQQSFIDDALSSDIQDDDEEGQSLKDKLKARRLQAAQAEQDEVVTAPDTTVVSLKDRLKARRQGQQLDTAVSTEPVDTGEVPEGFKAVPQVPTGDAPEDYLPKLEPIDEPTPTVSEQTDAVFKYEDTAKLAEEIEGVDILGVDEFVKESIAEPFQPIVRWIGQAANKDIANLAVAMEATAETTANIGTALTKGLKAVGVDIPFEDRVGGEKFAGDMGMMLEMIEAAVPGGSAAMRPVRKLFREAKQTAKLKAKGEKARAKLLDRKMNINKAKEATAEEIATKTARAEQVAAENVDLKNELILGFEEQTGKTISTVVDGVRVVDDELARKAGKETAREIEFKDRKTIAGDVITSGKDVEVADDDTARLLFNLQGESDSIVAPILKPE